MKSILPIILVVFSILLSPLAFAAAENASEMQVTSCGVENGMVTPGDGTICEQDIAFGMLYEMFPSIFNELLPLWNLSMFANLGDTPNTPKLLGEYRGDMVFFTLFDLFYNLVLLCLGVYIFLILLSILIRWLRGDEITDPNNHKDSPKTWIVGALLGGGFLIPYKQFFIGQMIIFSFAIGSLSMVNFVFSLFLSGNQSMYEITADATRPDKLKVQNDTQERHDFMADLFYRNLTRIELCRSQTSQYIMTGVGGKFSDTIKYRQAAACTLPVQGIRNEDVPVSVPYFANISTPLSASTSGGEVLFAGSTSIVFGSDASEADYCVIDKKAISSYDCGEITAIYPDWAKNPLVRLYGTKAGDFIYEHMSSLQSSMNTNMTPEQIESVLFSKWLILKKEMMDNLQKSWEKEHGTFEVEGADDLVTVNNEITIRREALKLTMIDNARPHIQQAAQFFHQSAMNFLMFGQSQKYQIKSMTDVLDESPVVKLTEDWTPIIHHLKEAEKLAELVQRAQCMDYKHDLHNAEATAKFLRGKIPIIPGKAHARCLDILNATVLEYDPDYNNKDNDTLRAEAFARLEELSLELNNEWDSKVGLLAAQRRAVEKSFINATTDETENKWWLNLRQKGYLAAADYAQSMNQRVNGFKRRLKQVVNNFTVSTGTFDERYISRNVGSFYKIDDSFPSFEYAGDQLFLETRLAAGAKDPFISNAQWIAEQEYILRENPLGVDSRTLIGDISYLMGISRTYMNRLGIGLSPTDKDPEKCLEDPAYCPFPLSDPIVEISLMGHEMVDVSLGFFAAAIPIKVLSGKSMEWALAKRKTGQAGVSKKGVLQQLDGLFGGSPDGALGGVFKFAKGVATVSALMDMIFDLFSSLMVLFLTLGLVLAYLLPLVPKIFLYLTFISWITVVVMASFSVLLWSMYWFRMKEKRDLLKTAAFHFGIELLFKPTFSLIAVIFAWYFFYVVAFAIGGTMGWLWAFSPTSAISNLYHTFFLVVMIVFVYLIGLKYVYQMMSDLSGELLKKLGVNNSKLQDKVSELIKVMLFDMAKGQTENQLNKLDKKMGRDAGKSYMQNRARSAQTLAAKYNKGMKDAQSAKQGSE